MINVIFVNNLFPPHRVKCDTLALALTLYCLVFVIVCIDNVIVVATKFQWLSR